MYIRKLTLSS